MQNLKSFTKLFLVLLFFILLFFVPRIVSANSKEENILVKFRETKNSETVAREYGISENQIKEIPRINVFAIKKPSFWQKSKLNLKKTFTKEIEYIEPDHLYKMFLTPDDPYYSSQWALPKISASSAWDLTTGSNSTKIAIVDTGINGLHEDLNSKVTAGYAFLDSGWTEYPIGANSDSDDHGHGTAVSGAAAAITDNAIGIAGLNWQAQLMPVRVFDLYFGQWGAYSSDIASGIIYAADNGAKVINLSLGGQYPSSTVENAVNYAYNSRGALVVGASGNENTSVSYPAKYENVVAVGATNESDERCDPSDWGVGYGSNYGPELDVVAPGNSIWTVKDSVLNNEYRTASGTSLAAPYVSGLAALIWASNSNLTNTQIRSRIENNTDKVSGMGGQNFTNEYGSGRINAYKVFSSEGTFIANYAGQSLYPTSRPGEIVAMSVSFTNTGTATWYSSGAHPIVLAIDKYQDENFLKTFDHGWISEYRIAGMNQTTIAPGETATFNFNIKVPENISPGRYRFYVRLVAENLTWFDNPDTNGGAWWEINVPRPTAEYVGQSLYPTAWPGETVAMSVTFRNSQGVSWVNSHPSTNLAIDKYQDEEFLKKFNSGWLSDYRIAGLPQSEVANGATATYNFNIKIPDDLSPGTYRFNVRLVQDGFSWFDNPDTNGGAWWEIIIPKPTAEYVDQSVYPTLSHGQTHTLTVQFRNTTGHTWPSTGSHPIILGLDKYWASETAWQGSGWISQNRIAVAAEGDVTSGSVGTYSFNIYVPPSMPSGKHRFYVRLVAEGFSWFDNPDTNGGAWWEITVQ